jgi:hypothetical protein
MPTLSERLLLMAAKISTETVFGWSHPDCADLVDAARIVAGNPPPPPEDDGGVLS